MTTIMEIRFGSHLYGTNTPASDEDFKAVFIPAANDILLQRAKATLSDQRPKAHGERNVAGDVDREAFALHRYLALVAEGQTVALDMLFAPNWALTRPAHPVWEEIQTNRRRLLSKRASSFVGYCRSQANKYGIRGSRVHAVRCLVEWFDAAIAKHGHLAKLGEALDTIPALIEEKALEHTAIVEIAHPSRPDPIRHLECCNRKAPEFTSLKDTRAIFARLLDEYGHRALAAERNEGVDWKALSHAARVGHEAIELLQTGHITFPLPNATHIRRIKQGHLPYAQVAEEIEQLLLDVVSAQATSALSEAPDHAFIDDLVTRAYRDEVMRPAGFEPATKPL